MATRSKVVCMNRTATANWSGNLKEGKGILTIQSGVMDNTNYTFKTLFEEGVKGTNARDTYK